MPDYFVIIVFILFILAISDLIVGVSNDAVNFLNSAIGSKVATRNTIMIIASLGILIGVTFSSGMMEVARKGIFNPQFFYFSEVMVIFMAVMITDIFLLDLFNLFGLPTSTTVSIVFELLGAAFALAVLKVIQNGEAYSNITTYINSANALAIILGILLSIGVAFVVGAIIQFISRLLFSFHYEKRIHSVGVIWSGIALTSLIYFLFFKGISGASFVTESMVTWINDRILILFLTSLIFWTIVMFLVQRFTQINILKIVVLLGTFSLAMAFAGNDLVNFIGVPIAGLESYRAWSVSNVAPDLYTMEALSMPVRTETYLLILAGLIMVLTLWFSKKAQSVTDTEVNLGRQGESMEDFQPNIIAQGIVRGSLYLGKISSLILPGKWMEKTEKQFLPFQKSKYSTKEKPAFDMVRASVNLTIASMLIAFATSLKLPLSTTYVSFMVAMGTSLSDRAWGRESAVYRVAGVLNVIAGWFATAIIAFTVAGLNAWIIYQFRGWGISLLLFLLISFIIISFRRHRIQSKLKDKALSFESAAEAIEPETLITITSEYISDSMKIISKVYGRAVNGLINEDLELLKDSRKALRKLKKENEELISKLFLSIKRLKGDDPEAARLYLFVYDLEQDILQSTTLIVEICENYVANSLTPLKKKQTDRIKDILQSVVQYFKNINTIIVNKQFDRYDEVAEEKKQLFTAIENEIFAQIKGIKSDEYGMRDSMLIFSLELETKDLVAIAARFLKLLKKSQEI